MTWGCSRMYVMEVNRKPGRRFTRRRGGFMDMHRLSARFRVHARTKNASREGAKTRRKKRREDHDSCLRRREGGMGCFPKLSLDKITHRVLPSHLRVFALARPLSPAPTPDATN